MATINKAFNVKYGLSLEDGEYRATILSDGVLSQDRELSPPDADGTLVVIDLPNSVSGAMIQAGTIDNSHIASDAAISVTKLAPGSGAGQVLTMDGDGNVPEWSDSLNLPGSLTVALNTTLSGDLTVETDTTLGGRLGVDDVATFATKIGIGPLLSGDLDEGELTWNEDTGCIESGIRGGLSQLLGQSTYITVRNGTGNTISAGKAVMFTGTIGNSGRIVVAPMVADGTYPGYVFLGITAQAILAGEDGYVATFGKIRKINTNAYTEQAILWCDPSTPGGLTPIEPEAPNLKLAVAAVVTQANNGTLMVRWDTGRRLSDLHDVESNGSTTDGEVLVYRLSQSRWEHSPDLDLPGTLSVQGVDIRSYSTGALESHLIRLNATAGVGIAGNVPFGVGPVLPTGMALAGIGPDSYNVVDIRSGSMC